MDVSLAGMPGWRASPGTRRSRRSASPYTKSSPICVTPAYPALSRTHFRLAAPAPDPHTERVTAPARRRREQILHNPVVRPVSSEHADYCLFQITDVTSPLHESGYCGCQNARTTRSLIRPLTRSSRSTTTALFSGSTARWIMPWVMDSRVARQRLDFCCSRTISWFLR